MAQNILHPDVVVGVDFGMTSTGVAYSAGPEWSRPETIQNWPGNSRGGIADKVDSKIAYDSSNNIAGWGFTIEQSYDNGGQAYEDFFKLYLDPDFRDENEYAPSLQEARKWFVDFLSCLFRTIDRHLNDTIPKYSSKRVDFRFSVPTTWKNPAMIAETEQLIRNAGFAKDNLLHTAEISLTEAEAAAVYVSRTPYSAGDTFLVCDAGGGTSDVNILKVISSAAGQTELAPLLCVEGKAIGSTLIDFKVEELIAKRLEIVQNHMTDTPLAVARRMLKETSRFESFKCNLGDDAMDLPTLRLTIPGLRPGLSASPYIENCQLLISKREVEAIFDSQIERICDLIDEQLSLLQLAYPREQITYLVLSGGLGSSKYLQQRLRQRYLNGQSTYACVRDLQILSVPKPQLAVCHGLVLDKVQQIKENKVVYKERFCRQSYGIVLRVEYNPQIHQGEPVHTDPRDNRTFAVNQIDWFIKQGEKVSTSDGIKKHYSLKVPLGNENLPWTTRIVMSTLPADKLPSSMNRPGARRLCNVESRLPSGMKVKNRHWYNGGDQYLKAEFDVQVIIGPADLKFRTLGKDGILSQSHDTIAIEWYSGSGGKERPRAVVAELSGDTFAQAWTGPSTGNTSVSDGLMRRFTKRM